MDVGFQPHPFAGVWIIPACGIQREGVLQLLLKTCYCLVIVSKLPIDEVPRPISAQSAVKERMAQFLSFLWLCYNLVQSSRSSSRLE